MSHETIGKLIDKWLNDPGFRQAIREDPEGTIKKSGAEFSSEEWAAFRKIDWDIPDQDLEGRINKLFV